MLMRLVLLVLGFTLVPIGMTPLNAKSRNKVSAVPPRPGAVLAAAGGNQILMEGNRSLYWVGQGNLSIRDAMGNIQLQVDLRAAPEQEGGAKAMGLDVEEADLGGAYSSKKYLKGKKDPKGRELDASKVGQAPSQKEKGTVTKSSPQGIPVTLTQYPNGSYLLKFDWGKTTEEIYFDQRNTMISVEQRQTRGPFGYSLKQYSDGSFSRYYEKGEGSVTYTYDSIDQSYRLVFANKKGQKVAEAHCDRACTLE